MKNFVPTARGKPDAIVIGASIGGLAAAACLAKAGKHVLVLEKQAAPPEPVGPVYALDPELLPALRLLARGLTFVSRDLPLALPGPSGGLVLLSRNRHQAAKAIGALSTADVAAWAGYRAEIHGLARALRRWWWSALEEGAADWVVESAKAKARFARLSLTGADAFLAGHFESDALVAALLFDASAAGLQVSEPGSALALIWRAAQEMAGLEGAAAMPVPGTLVWSLIKAAGESDFRCCATVTGLLTHGGRVVGVRLASGEEIEAGTVFSSLSTEATFALTGAARNKPETGEARILIGLNRRISFPPVRLILAERSGIYADAHEAARAGKLADELPMELVAADSDSSGASKIAVTLRPVPAVLSAEDQVQLTARAVQALSRQSPGAARLISDLDFVPCAYQPRASLGQLLAPSIARVKTKIGGLYLCGADAEPLASLSGRAARIAVRLALMSENPAVQK
jgi:phytoene dehydrogenase-like protein